MDNLQSQQSVALPRARSPEGTAPSIIQAVESRQSAAPPSGRVFRSVDNILYLTGGSNEVSSLYTEEGFRKSVDTASWLKLIAQRRSTIHKFGSMFAQLLVPEKLTILPLSDSDRAKALPGVEAKHVVPPGRRFLQQGNTLSVIYPDDFLRVQSRKLPIYMPTDSHWTWQGAFSAFQMLMSGFHRRPEYKSFVALPKVTLRYRGDLWESHFPDIGPDPFQRVTLPSSIRRVYANQMVGLKEKGETQSEQGLHMGSHCIFANPAAEFQETVILFGSSFSECRLGPSLLTSIFVHYFAPVHFTWSTSVDFAYVEIHKPVITIAELPERFFTFPPTDTSGVEVTSVEKIRAWRQRNGT